MMCRVMILDTSCYAFYAALEFGTVHDVFDGYEDGPTTSNSTPEKFTECDDESVWYLSPLFVLPTNVRTNSNFLPDPIYRSDMLPVLFLSSSVWSRTEFLR